MTPKKYTSSKPFLRQLCPIGKYFCVTLRTGLQQCSPRPVPKAPKTCSSLHCSSLPLPSFVPSQRLLWNHSSRRRASCRLPFRHHDGLTADARSLSQRHWARLMRICLRLARALRTGWQIALLSVSDSAVKIPEPVPPKRDSSRTQRPATHNFS